MLATPIADVLPKVYQEDDDMPTQDDAIFTLVFHKGLAERNRLPIEQVIKTLQEFQEMIREVGKLVQRKNGVENPTGDFGIELLASPNGLVFRKGSLKANAALTRDLMNAKETLHLVVDNVRDFKRKPVIRVEEERATIARRMFRIGELQREAKTELTVQVKTKDARQQTATLDEQTIVNLEALTAPLMKIGGITLFGRLRQLRDQSKEEDGGKHFWGELTTESGEIWRLRFPESEISAVLPLFRKRVSVLGNATYFGAKHPRLDVINIGSDEERDYLAAFESFRQFGQEIFGENADADELKRELCN